MGVPSLNDLAVDGTLNTTNQPTNWSLNSVTPPFIVGMMISSVTTNLCESIS